MQFFWGACLKTAKDADHPYASPLRADTLRDVAPAMILTAEFDPLLDEGERYSERLRAAGAPTRTVRYDGLIHGFMSYLGRVDAARIAVAECGTALTTRSRHNCVAVTPDSNKERKQGILRIGVVTEPLANRPLVDVMDWLTREVAEATDLEIGTGGYAPTTHCDMRALLHDPAARKAWLHEITTRGLRIGALNVWGNPLHPDSQLGSKHDADLRDTIRLAAALGVDRVVALAGCPAGAPGDQTPHFSGGGWLPYLEDVYRAQWESSVEPYWSAIADFARREHEELLICLELHPGTVVYNVESFNRLAGLGDAIAANIDPSHFFWMGMDARAVVAALGARAGHCHGKDVVFSPDNLAINGLLDRRWPRPAEAMPWNFAVVGRGKDREWWTSFIADLAAGGRVHTIAIEHEDPFVAPEAGISEAAALLSSAVLESDSPAARP